MISLFIISLLSLYCVDGNTNSLPKTFNQRAKPIAIGAASVLALSAFKIVADGPIFREPVDMKDKIVAITGGNSGLGKEAAIKLASLGAQVIILSRPSKKTDDALKEIAQASGSTKVDAIPLDLTDLSSVKACATALSAKVAKIDVLMNNAGVMAVPTREVTKDGFELQLGTNHLGHFLLTNELMGLLKKSPNARLVI